MGAASKTATATAPMLFLLAERWSPRAFDPHHELTDTQVTALLEAARWAPSASNTQPWRFAVTLRGSADHAAVFGALAPGNRAWAHGASALVVAAAETAARARLPLPALLLPVGPAPAAAG